MLNFFLLMQKVQFAFMVQYNISIEQRMDLQMTGLFAAETGQLFRVGCPPTVRLQQCAKFWYHTCLLVLRLVPPIFMTLQWLFMKRHLAVATQKHPFHTHVQKGPSVHTCSITMNFLASVNCQNICIAPLALWAQ